MRMWAAAVKDLRLERLWIERYRFVVEDRERFDQWVRSIVRGSMQRGEMSVWAWCEVLHCSRSTVYRMLGRGGAGLKRGPAPRTGRG